ncbi:pirin family protein [Methanolobus bombayensis]|uniref:pirin family protein n=1 Tax=Methanolobus bombayensis TaxID=38023 RepID=UPI001AE94B59|nr:pirin family protein [Methanolobus bombayensis]MBP1908369.1 redox-sensitive bicupin YhaK (pirin superfamily) [Methanolobus bombayensis]
MIKVVRADERHFVENDSINGYWIFSYSDYLDMQNTHFGDLKVFNDEILKTGKLYKPESVNDKEIVTIVLEGELSHEDSTGARETLKAGDVQVLSSGSGATFTDMNLSGKDVHLCRMWIEPLMQNMKPACRQENFDLDNRKNELVPVAGQGYPGAVKLRANTTVYMSKIDSGKVVDILTDVSRYVFIYVLEGEITTCGEKLGKNDQIRINQNEEIVIEANSDACFVLVDSTGIY